MAGDEANTRMRGKTTLRREVRRALRDRSAAWLGATVLGVACAGVSTNAMSEPFPAVFPLVSLLPAAGGDGSDGFLVRGLYSNQRTGRSTAAVGDVNADGFDDILFGSNRESYLLFGRSSGFPATSGIWNLSPAGGGDGSEGGIIRGAEPDDFGISVGGGADVNGDGVDDFIIGDRYSRLNGDRAGAAFVVFGHADWTPLTNLNGLRPEFGGDGSRGFIVLGAENNDWLGWSVGRAGDVNADGRDDLIVSARQAAGGDTYILFGRETFQATVDAAALYPAGGGDGNEGVVLQGFGGDAGQSVSALGDVNGDDIDDVVIGAFMAAGDAGEAYVVFGRSGGFPATVPLADLLPENGGHGTTGFVLRGREDNDYAGFSVAGPGDVNGDGLADVLVGAPRANRDGKIDVGESYVIFGRTDGFAPLLELASLLPENGGDGSEGFAIRGEDARGEAGRSVAGAGDINGDGIADVVIGAEYSQRMETSTGEAYVVFGRMDGFPPIVRLRSLFPPAGGDGSEGFVIRALENSGRLGYSVSAAGDLTGDGVDDLLLAAPRADTTDFNAGEIYVIVGRDTTEP